MTIRKGEDWGVPVDRPSDLRVAASDAELAQLVARDRAGRFGLSGGDLFRSVGAPPAREAMQRLPCDALLVRLDDGPPRWAVANVVARRRRWAGRFVIVANCSQLGTWNVAPRAHPNDGRFDVIESAGMALRARLQARNRLPHGTHLPHPALTVRAVTAGEWTFSRPIPVAIDGVEAGRCTRLAVEIRPDHFSIHV